MKKVYILVCASTIEEFENLVNERIAEGYILSGQLVVAEGKFLHSMENLE